MTVTQAIEYLRTYYDPDDEVCMILWSTEDVRREQDPDNPLTDDEVSDILEDMALNHDATIGVNWDVIQTYVQERQINQAAEELKL